MRTYSVIEAAAELGISRNLVYALCQRRKIRHERHGVGCGKIGIPEDGLEEYRRKQTVGVEERGGPTPVLKHITLR